MKLNENRGKLKARYLANTCKAEKAERESAKLPCYTGLPHFWTVNFITVKPDELLVSKGKRGFLPLS